MGVTKMTKPIDEQSLRILIREVVLEFLAERRVLVLFTGALVGSEDAIASLRELAKAGVRLDAVFTPSAKRVIPEHFFEGLPLNDVTKNLVSDHRVLVVPTMTTNTVAKLVHGVTDSLATNVISEFIMLDRPIIAAKDAADPDAPAKQAWFPTMPAAYANMLRTNLKTLASFGVHLCEAQDLARDTLAVLDGPPRGVMSNNAPMPAGVVPVVFEKAVLGSRDLRVLAPGSRVHISPSTIVTAMARDYAAANQIALEVRKGS